MRWIACVVLLAGCLRARATAVHPTEHERVNGGSGPRTSIAREVPQEAGEGTNLASVELGALVPFSTADSTRVHIAPGVRIFDSQTGTVLWGVAVGADYAGKRGGPGFALEGSVYVGDGGADPAVINQALDLFAGVTVGRALASIAVGPSVGLLAMPGGHSVVMFGLGLRVTSRRGE